MHSPKGKGGHSDSQSAIRIAYQLSGQLLGLVMLEELKRLQLRAIVSPPLVRMQQNLCENEVGVGTTVGVCAAATFRWM
jgi:hypothetical protein